MYVWFRYEDKGECPVHLEAYASVSNWPCVPRQGEVVTFRTADGEHQFLVKRVEYTVTTTPGFGSDVGFPPLVYLMRYKK